MNDTRKDRRDEKMRKISAATVDLKENRIQWNLKRNSLWNKLLQIYRNTDTMNREVRKQHVVMTNDFLTWDLFRRWTVMKCHSPQNWSAILSKKGVKYLAQRETKVWNQNGI